MRNLAQERQRRGKVSYAGKKEPSPSQKPEIPDTSRGEGYAKNTSGAPKRRGTFEG